MRNSPIGLIPNNFGTFPNTFVSSLLEYSMENSINMDVGLFFSNHTAPNLFEQELTIPKIQHYFLFNTTFICL